MLHRCRLCLAVIPRSSVQTSRTFVESASQRASSVPPRSRYIYDSHSQQWIKRPPHRPSVSREERQERAAEAASIEATGDSQLGRPVQPTDHEIRSALKDDKPRYVRGQDSSTLKVRLGGDSFAGLPLPIRPSPPESDSCCMSGCPRCVYDIYTEDLQLYHEALSQTRRQLRAKGVDVKTWPEALRPPALSSALTSPSNVGVGDDDGIPIQDQAMDIAAQEVTYEIRGLDISLRTFLQFERELRRRRAKEQAKKIGLEHVTGIPETRQQEIRVQ